jgi:hypothetical protein
MNHPSGQNRTKRQSAFHRADRIRAFAPALTLAAAATLLVVACAGGGKKTAATPTISAQTKTAQTDIPRATPTPTPRPTPRPTPIPTPPPTPPAITTDANPTAGAIPPPTSVTFDMPDRHTPPGESPMPDPIPVTTPVPSLPSPEPSELTDKPAAENALASAGMDRETYLALPYPRIKVSRCDEADRDPAFQETLTGLQAAIARRNLDGLLAVIATDRIVGAPGGEAGMAGFLTHWQLTYAPRQSPLWSALSESLDLGIGYDEASGTYHSPCLRAAVPYVEQIMDKNIDPDDRALINGAQVNVRSEPSLDGETLAQLSYEIVKLAGEPDPATSQTIGGQTHPWWPITLYDGKRAHVYGKFVRPWKSNEARFEKIDGTWKLTRFAPRED